MSKKDYKYFYEKLQFIENKAILIETLYDIFHNKKHHDEKYLKDVENRYYEFTVKHDQYKKNFIKEILKEISNKEIVKSDKELLNEKEFLLKELKKSNIHCRTDHYVKGYKKNYKEVDGNKIVIIYCDKYMDIYTNEYDIYYSNYSNLKEGESHKYYIYKKNNETPYVFVKDYSPDFVIIDKFFNYTYELNKENLHKVNSDFFTFTNKLIGNLSKYE